MLACSKKCKKVTKFAYMLKKNNENEILKTFESMLRKKMQKNLEQAGRMVNKSLINFSGATTNSNVNHSIAGDASKQQYLTAKSKTTRSVRNNNETW